MAYPHYDIDVQQLAFQAPVDTSGVIVYLDQAFFARYTSQSSAMDPELNDNVWQVAIPELYITQAQQITLDYLTPEGTVSTTAKISELYNSTEAASRKTHKASTHATPFEEWLAAQSQVSGDDLSDAYLQAADWRHLAATDFELFIEVLFLIVLMRRPSEETRSFYTGLFGPARDFKGAIRRITHSNEAIDLHVSHSALNPGIRELVQDIAKTAGTHLDRD